MNLTRELIRKSEYQVNGGPCSRLFQALVKLIPMSNNNDGDESQVDQITTLETSKSGRKETG